MSENEKVGMTETAEAVVGFLKLATVMAEAFKDGVQAEDFVTVLGKLQAEPLKSQLLAAYNGIDKVPSEAKDIDLMEVIALMPVIVPEVGALMKALKK